MPKLRVVSNKTGKVYEIDVPSDRTPTQDEIRRAVRMREAADNLQRTRGVSEGLPGVDEFIDKALPSRDAGPSLNENPLNATVRGMKESVFQGIKEFAKASAAPINLVPSLIGVGAAARGVLGTAKALKAKKAFAANPKPSVRDIEVILDPTIDSASAVWQGAMKRIASAANVDLPELTVGGKYVVKRPKRTMDYLPGFEQPGSDIPKITLSLDKEARGDFSGKVLPVLKRWVDRRASAKAIDTWVESELAPLRELGKEAIYAFQKGDRSNPLYQKVDDMMKKAYREEKLAGVPHKGYKANYLHQMWSDDPVTVGKVFGNKPKTTVNTGAREVTTRPKFTLDSVFDTYAHGESRGLTSKYDNIVDIVKARLIKSNKAIADREMLEFARRNKFIAKDAARSRSKGMIPLGDRFPRIKTKQGMVNYIGNPEFAKYVRNYLDEPSDAIRNTAGVFKLLKNNALTSGVPKTIINAHGKNILTRSYLTEGIPGFARSFVQGFPGMLKRTANKFYSDPANTSELVELAKHGKVTSGFEDYLLQPGQEGLDIVSKMKGSKNRFVRGFGKMQDFAQKTWEEPLFRYKLPYESDRLAIKRFRELMAQGMERSAALREAADEANTFFGSMNYVRNYDPSKGVAGSLLKSGGATRGTVTGANIGLIAPEWLGSNIKLGAKMAGSMAGKADPIYAKALARAIAAKSVATAAKAASGMKAYDIINEQASQVSNLPTGTTESGRSREVPLFGTAAEAIRIPDQFAHGLQTGDFGPFGRILANRLNPAFGAVARTILNVDPFGNPIHTRDRFGNPISMSQSVKNIGAELVSPVLPPYVRSFADYARGRIGLEEALGQGFEAPFTYRYIPKPKGRNNPYSAVKFGAATKFPGY